jgi:hypothetical protein
MYSWIRGLNINRKFGIPSDRHKKNIEITADGSVWVCLKPPFTSSEDSPEPESIFNQTKDDGDYLIIGTGPQGSQREILWNILIQNMR